MKLGVGGFRMEMTSFDAWFVKESLSARIEGYDAELTECELMSSGP